MKSEKYFSRISHTCLNGYKNVKLQQNITSCSLESNLLKGFFFLYKTHCVCIVTTTRQYRMCLHLANN